MTLLLLFALLWVTSAFIPLSFLPRASNSRKAVYGPFCKVYTTSRASLEHPTDIRGEISSIVEQVVNYSRNRNGLSGFDPKTLMEHAHIITQGNEYESVIQAKLEAAHGADEVADLKNADALLKGFIQSERKQRARLKMNYILAGAETGRLDDAIQLLSDSEEIDGELLLYIDNLIKKELLRSSGPSLRLEEHSSNSLVDAEKKLVGAPKDTLSVLRMVQKLLRAELRTENASQVRFLARLINEPSPEVRYTLLKAQLDKVELLESFSEFVEGGIAHLSLQRTTATGETSNANNGEHSEVNDATPALPAAVVEKLKDILYDVEKLKLRLKTGLKDAGTYSTVTEDYIDTD